MGEIWGRNGRETAVAEWRWAQCVDVPAEGFAANSLAWCAQADGAQAIVLNDASPGAAKQASSNHFCVVYFSEQ